MTFFDDFEIMGIFQIEAFDNTIFGKITYNKYNECRLLIISAAGISLIEKLESVRGILETGEQILLEKCIRTHAHLSGSIQRVEYIITRMFIGKNLDWNELKFNKLAIQYTSLYSWLNPASIKVNSSSNPNYQSTIEFEAPTNIEIMLSNEFTLQINFGFKKSSAIVNKDYTIAQSAATVLVSKKPLRYQSIYNKITYIRNFLIIATGTLVQPKTIHIASSNNEFASTFPAYKIYNDIVEEQDFLKLNFNFSQISNDFDTIIKDWFEFSATHQKSLEIYFQTLLDARWLTVEIRFLRIAQALEAVHRIDVSQKGAFEERLKYVFKNSHNINTSDILEEQFITLVKKIRDYYSHGYIDDYQTDMPNMTNLIKIVERLDLLMYGYIINKLRLPDTLKNSIMKKKIENVQKIKIF